MRIQIYNCAILEFDKKSDQHLKYYTCLKILMPADITPLIVNNKTCRYVGKYYLVGSFSICMDK